MLDKIGYARGIRFEEWRKEHKVKNFTEWQAKRFAKWYKENGGK